MLNCPLLRIFMATCREGEKGQASTLKEAEKRDTEHSSIFPRRVLENRGKHLPLGWERAQF
jgi:hypothetical protein